MALVLLNPPAVEPVSLAELKEFLRVDAGDTSQDNTLTGHLMTARDWVEVKTQRRMVQQTWRLLMDFFPGYIDLKLAGQKVSSPFVSGSNAVLVGIRYAIVLPFPPVSSIVDFQYQDANGNVTAMSAVTPDNPSGTYVQDLQSNPARLTPPFGQMWPVARVVPNAVQVDFQCGYAMPLTLSVAPSSPVNLFKIQASSYTFQLTDVNRPISIQGGGANGGVLDTVIAGINSPPDSGAMLRDPLAASVQNTAALLVNNPNANASHFVKMKTAIKAYAEGVWRRVDPAIYEKQARNICYSASDLRF